MPVRPTSATVLAKAVATATSTTLPPAPNSSAPTAAAVGCWAETTPRWARAGGSPARATVTKSRMAAMLAEGLDQRGALQATDGQAGIEPLGAHARALADAVAAPHAVPPVH